MLRSFSEIRDEITRLRTSIFCLFMRQYIHTYQNWLAYVVSRSMPKVAFFEFAPHAQK